MFLGVLAALAGALISTVIASAHSRPLRFDPAPGAVLQAAPAKIDGWFGSEIRRDPNWSFIHVTDASGTRVDTGESALSTNRLQQTATLKSGLGPGQYIVTWRTYDDGDGEIFGDCYTFFVGQAAADAAVAAKTRLDGGSKCDRIEISGKDGTPTPQKVSAAATAAVMQDTGNDAGPTSDQTDSGGGRSSKLILGLVIGAVAGIAIGGLGGRMLGKRPS
jgi:methionine-rich copper-binding protein CopC